MNEDLTPKRFMSELWGIFPDDHVAEFFLKWEAPKTAENPEGQKVTPKILHYTVSSVLKDFDRVFGQLIHFNKKYMNVHPCVNPRYRKPNKRGKNSDVQSYGALWADFDYHENEAAVEASIARTLEYLKSLDLWPSAIIHSGRGKHFYWLLDKPYPVAEARPICAGIQDACKLSDPINDPSRVLRMPGTFNVKDKNNPKPCQILEATWRRYELSRFKDFHVEPGRSAEEIEEEEFRKKIDAEIREIELQAGPDSAEKNARRSRWKTELVDLLGGVGEGKRNDSAARLAGHYFAVGWKADSVLAVLSAWNSRNTPPMEQEELETVVKSIGAAEAAKPSKKMKGERGDTDHVPQLWLKEDGKFNPAIMAMSLYKNLNILSSPIGKNGRGVESYIYRNGVYQPGGKAFLTKHIFNLLKFYTRSFHINEVIDLIQVISHIEYTRLNPQGRELINVQNGMLDWKTGELKPHDPSYLSSIQLPVEYDPKAQSPDLDKFFADIFPADCISLIEEFVGYLLIPDTSLQKFFIAVGAGGNGKGTFLKLLTYLLGSSNVCALPIHAIEEDKFAAANLLGKLANIFHDLDSRLLESTGTLKSIVSGDPISGEYKYESRFDFTPYARLVFSANEFPRANDKSEAWFDRLIFVPFPQKFRATSRCIPDYERVLMQKPGLLSAFLNRAITGLRRLMATRTFSKSEASKKALEAYQRESNSALEFLHETCSIHPEASGVRRKDLYEAYKEWCADNNMKAYSTVNFCKVMRLINGIRETAQDGDRIWLGVQWKEGKPPQTRDSEVRGFPDKRQRGVDF